MRSDEMDRTGKYAANLLMAARLDAQIQHFARSDILLGNFRGHFAYPSDYSFKGICPSFLPSHRQALLDKAVTKETNTLRLGTVPDVDVYLESEQQRATTQRYDDAARRTLWTLRTRTLRRAGPLAVVCTLTGYGFGCIHSHLDDLLRYAQS
jgi:hypothetical protein